MITDQLHVIHVSYIRTSRHLARHDLRYGGHQACRVTKYSCATEERSISMGWPCCQNKRWKTPKAPAVWRTIRGEDVYLNQQRVLGKPSSWARHLAQPDPEVSWVLWTNQDTPGGRKEIAPQIQCCGNRLRLLLLFHVQTTTEMFVPESALSATSGHIAYMRQISGHHPRRMDEQDKGFETQTPRAVTLEVHVYVNLHWTRKCEITRHT